MKDIIRNKNKNDWKSMFDFYLDYNATPVGKGTMMDMAYESTKGVDSAIPQSLWGDVDNTSFYVYDYTENSSGELIDLRTKLKFSNTKVDVTIVVNGDVLYKEKLPEELENETFHQALNYVFNHDEVEAFDIRPKSEQYAKGGGITNVTKNILKEYIFEYHYPKYKRQPETTQKYKVDVSKVIPIGGMGEDGFKLITLDGNDTGVVITLVKALQAIRIGEIEFEQSKDYFVKIKAIKNNEYANGGGVGELEIGNEVEIELNNGKIVKGKVEKINPLKIRTDATSTQVIPNALIKNVKQYANGGGVENKGDINKTYLEKQSDESKYVILNNISKHYDISIEEAFEQVTDAEAEYLYEYIADNNRLRHSIYYDFQKFDNGGGVELSPRQGGYKHNIGDGVEVWKIGGKSKLGTIIGFEKDGTYIISYEDGTKSYTPKKYIANASGEFPLMANSGGVGNYSDVMNWSKDKLEKFLTNNWGFRGVEGKGITKNKEDRTIENMRIEVVSQMKYNDENKIEYANGGGVDEITMTDEEIVRDSMFNGEIKLDTLTDIIGFKPNYPYQIVGTLKLEKCFLRPCYRIA